MGPKFLAKLVYSISLGLVVTSNLLGIMHHGYLGVTVKPLKAWLTSPWLDMGGPPPPVKTEWVKL